MPRRALPDGLAYYNLEDYLFGEVSHGFIARGWIDAFDFFSIVIWKANRAKSVTAKRLLKLGATRGLTDLDGICRAITEDVHAAATDKARLFVLMDTWKFLLPMASAILTVLYPERFTVYDYRVCEELQQMNLGNFKDLASKTNVDVVWPDYEEFMTKVRETHQIGSLRDKDRALMGRSMAKDLEQGILNRFSTPANQTSHATQPNSIQRGAVIQPAPYPAAAHGPSKTTS